MTQMIGAFAVITAVAALGCSAPAARTTFLRSVDLVDMTDQMARSFAADPVIGQRTPADDPWVVSIAPVANQTNQIIPSREKWLYVVRLRSLLARSDLAYRRHIVWVIPPEQWPPAADELADPELRTRPTHVLAAQFQTLTNTSGSGRSDMYVCSFQLTTPASGRLVWVDWWEVKRATSGLTYD